MSAWKGQTELKKTLPHLRCAAKTSAHEVTVAAEVLTVPCACHSPPCHGHGLSCVTARPQPSSQHPTCRTCVWGNIYRILAGSEHFECLVLSENKHQQCCSDTQQQLQPDKRLFVQASYPKVFVLRNQDTTATSNPQFPCHLLVIKISSF